MKEGITLIPQGELLDFEESKLYGLWDGGEWWEDGRGIVFTSLHRSGAWAQANTANNYDPAWATQRHAWRVYVINSASWPVGCPERYRRRSRHE